LLHRKSGFALPLLVGLQTVSPDSARCRDQNGHLIAPSYSSFLCCVAAGITISFQPKIWASTEKAPGPIRAIATSIAISRKTTIFEVSKPHGNVVQTRVAAHSAAASGLTSGVKNPIRTKTPVNMKKMLTAKTLTVRIEHDIRCRMPWAANVEPAAALKTKSPTPGAPRGNAENSLCSVDLPSKRSCP
jgi:hypothetical protein